MLTCSRFCDLVWDLEMMEKAKGSLKNFGPRREPERWYFMIFSLWSWRPLQKTHHPIATQESPSRRGGDTPITERRLQKSSKDRCYKVGSRIDWITWPMLFHWRGCRIKKGQIMVIPKWVPLLFSSRFHPHQRWILEEAFFEKMAHSGTIGFLRACRLAFWNEFFFDFEITHRHPSIKAIFGKHSGRTPLKFHELDSCSI